MKPLGSPDVLKEPWGQVLEVIGQAINCTQLALHVEENLMKICHRNVEAGWNIICTWFAIKIAIFTCCSHTVKHCVQEFVTPRDNCSSLAWGQPVGILSFLLVNWENSMGITRGLGMSQDALSLQKAPSMSTINLTPVFGQKAKCLDVWPDDQNQFEMCGKVDDPSPWGAQCWWWPTEYADKAKSNQGGLL